MPITLVLADSCPLILDALEHLLRTENDFEIVARCTDGEQTLKAVHKHQPDILMLDLRMPNRDGIEVLRELWREKLATRVVILTAELQEDDLAEAVGLGVRGLVLKNLPTTLIVQCLRRVHAGELWLEKQSVGNALERLVRVEAGKNEVSRRLTPREIEIGKKVAIGLRNNQVAKQLFISEGTVKIHLHNIYKKLQIHSRVELSHYAQKKGLV